MKDKTIHFDPPLQFAESNPVSTVTMREPRVKDMREGEKIKGTDLDKEVAMVAKLSGINPEDLDSLTVDQYKKLQDAYAGFFSRGGGSSEAPA